MKKILAMLLVAIMAIVSAFSLTACGGTEGVSVKNAYVDENTHLIVEFTDGTKKDLGYVGVEIEKEVLPPLYTVTFVDINGNVLDTQQVYKGLAANTPTAPQVKDQVFSGWSVDITNIQGNVTVSPVYGNMASFKVTFKDDAGNVLKEETVITGRSATPPSVPNKGEMVFDRWDKSYANITADTVITAIYRAKGNYTVTFKDYSGVTLGTANVKEGESAAAPVTPTREGYTFKGWSGSLNNVTSDKTVTAEYTLINATNVFDISYNVSGNNVTVTLSLAGDVCLAGFEGTLSFEGMTVVNATAKSTYALINTSGNSVKMTYSNATNVTKGEVVLEVKLTKTADNGKANLNLTDCFDQNFDSVSYKVIGQNLKLK